MYASTRNVLNRTLGLTETMLANNVSKYAKGGMKENGMAKEAEGDKGVRYEREEEYGEWKW